MTRKRIEIRELRSGVAATAVLLESEAPKTCAALWECLEEPIETDGIQAAWVGPEIMLVVPKHNQRVDVSGLPEENATALPQPGDVLFRYYPPHCEQHYVGELHQDEAIWDLFFIYGCDPVTGGGSFPVFARIEEGLEALASECRKVRHSGNAPFRVARLPRRAV